MSSRSSFIVFVYTGEEKYAGTNNSVHIILHGDDGKCSREVCLDHKFIDNLESGKVCCFYLTEENVGELGRFANIERLELWKDFKLGLFSDDWFVDKIVVENNAKKVTFVFPLFRWIKSGYRYNFQHLNTCLPQLDKFPEQREMEILDKRRTYTYEQKIPDGPMQIKKIPGDELFSFDYKFFIQKSGFQRRLASWFTKLCSKKWNSFDDILEVFDQDIFEIPKCINRWKSDTEFSRQRTACISSSLIFLVTKIPEKFPVTDELVKPLLGGLTIKEAIQLKRIFMCDLEIMEDIPHVPELVLCSPMAMFFVNDAKQLLPIAIQLFQKPGPDNPIFTPLDDPMLWLYVKIWFNNADAMYHQSITHLGLTHLVMEGVVIAMHRCLSSTHPVFKLLAPHFLYLIAINTRGLPQLIEPGGYVDKIMVVGRNGFVALIKKALSSWRMNVEGLLPEELKSRGVDDPNVLPGYHFRDDAMLVFNAIKKYVTSYIQLYYESNELIKGDKEIQALARELVAEKGNLDGGIGLKGVPGNGKLDCAEDLVSILTSVIYTCSVAHAASNFSQYERYAYPPNSPGLIYGKVPTSKDERITEKEIVNNMPNKHTTLETMIITGTLSQRATRSLGDFEVQYVFDPKALKILEEFREDLKEVGQKIRARNQHLEIPYEYLLPEAIPNAISI